MERKGSLSSRKGSILEPVTTNGDPSQNEDSTPIDKSPLAIQRSNLLHVSKLVIKALIDTAVTRVHRTLSEENPTLEHFLTVMENVVCHGLRPPRRGMAATLLTAGLSDPDPWAVVEAVMPRSRQVDITETVRDMAELKTGLGRLRAWLRLALMEKRLSDYFRILLDQRSMPRLRELYDPGAIFFHEEATVIGGMLVGIGIIDCNFIIKDKVNDFDKPLGIINYSVYMRKTYEDCVTELPADHSSVNDSQFDSMCDQKNYLEELNEHLKVTSANLQKRTAQAEASTQDAKKEAADARNEMVLLQEEVEIIRAEKESIMSEFDRFKRATEADLKTERETYQTSRFGLDGINSDLQRRIKDEVQMRLDAEKALENEIKKKTDNEISQGRSERELHDKQEVIVTLRKQIDEIKAINLDLSSKTKAAQEVLEHKTMLVTRLEDKCNGLTNIMDQMEKRIQGLQADKFAAEETARKVGQQMAILDARCSEKETDLRIQTELRQSALQQLEKKNAEINKLNTTIEELRSLEKDCERFRDEVSRLTRVCCEQENALADMASHLTLSKLETDNLKEAHASFREAQWADDKQVTDCRKCVRPFNVSRRRHHCRQCGGIFCNECSSNSMPLPSSAKPVRVCDACHNMLLERYSQKS